MHRALLGVANALSTVGVEQMGRGHVAGADGGIGLERNADQAELQQAGPTGPAVGGVWGKRQRVGGVGSEGIVHGRGSVRGNSYGPGPSAVPECWASGAGPVESLQSLPVGRAQPSK